MKLNMSEKYSYEFFKKDLCFLDIEYFSDNTQPRIRELGIVITEKDKIKEKYFFDFHHQNILDKYQIIKDTLLNKNVVLFSHENDLNAINQDFELQNLEIFDFDVFDLHLFLMIVTNNSFSLSKWLDEFRISYTKNQLHNALYDAEKMSVLFRALPKIYVDEYNNNFEKYKNKGSKIIKKIIA